ncbi:hypothetical protein O181_047713 [Austropuccinia psidii MF-1]|uniref:Uncharacterized protein n=1 Tax=Austropuccinia psidii MF-1 TaxID=1389203 RepID=A0A9Q3HJS9_9BASI|nr:hypothetical protein [Austropuccinia psidii MF-1]
MGPSASVYIEFEQPQSLKQNERLIYGTINYNWIDREKFSGVQTHTSILKETPSVPSELSQTLPANRRGQVLLQKQEPHFTGQIESIGLPWPCEKHHEGQEDQTQFKGT